MKKIFLPFLCMFLFFTNGCSHVFRPTQKETDVERLFQKYDAARASHDVEKIASFFTDDCIYEDVASGVVRRGKEELKAFITTTLTSFPDFNVEITSFFVAGDWVGSEWIMTGTRTGPFPDSPTDQKKFSIRGVSITELHEGKIKRNSDYWNMASYLHQVGLMPIDSSENL